MIVPSDERRTETPVSSDKLYKLGDLQDVIEKERREDELDRLRDVLEQKRTWRNVLLICGFLNLILFSLAVSGVLWP